MRKAYARQVGSFIEVYTRGRPIKQSRGNIMVIDFSNDDYIDISFPHMVVTLIVANHNVHRILMNNGSSTNILYWFAFEKLNLGQERVVPTN